MTNQTPFKIQQGAVISDCMQETHDFITQNLEYFHSALQPAREALGNEAAITFISHESQWSLACRIDKSELGKVAAGAGIISESSVCPYDDLLLGLADSE